MGLFIDSFKTLNRTEGRGSTMMPIGPLMIEHRLIERMIDVMGKRSRSLMNDRN